MSIEIWQFPRAATRDDLLALLQELGYERANNLFWPGPAGTISMYWSEPKDFKSTSGVDASVFPLDASAKKAWSTTNGWGLRTRTSIWASSFDKEHQNHSVRRVRQRFGGRFYNDHDGHNRYIPIVRAASTPVSRGISALLSRVTGELESLEHALPEESIKVFGTPQGIITDQTDTTGVLQFTKQFDPTRVLLNGLVPFLVAAIEHFFRESFEILLKYDPKARAFVEEQNRRISFAEAAALVRDELTLERVVSSWYSFQNIDSIQKAFKDTFGIDVWKAIRRRKKIRKKMPILGDALKNLIGARHGVVHHFSLDRSLDRDEFLDLVHLTRALIELMAAEIERRLGVRLAPG
jgi:hypothetical protein